MDRKNALFAAVIGLAAFASGRVLQRSGHASQGAEVKDAAGVSGARKADKAASVPGRELATPSPAPAPLPATAAKAETPTLSAPRPAPPPCDATHPLFQVAADFPATVQRTDDCKLSVADGKPALHMVLATLVSPLVAGFSSDFDRAIESIERAAQSRSYVLQRHFFPWEAKHLGDGKDKPGWLVFRRAAGRATELLVVLVVGEHPSVGVDATALDAALYDAAAVVPHADSGPLLVLGPYFSGSAVSLTQHLAAWCARADDPRNPLCATRSLIAVSGSATVPKTQAVFEALGTRNVFASTAFAATVLPDELLRAGMRRFLHEQLGDRQDEVADLTESSTEYGVESAEANAGPGAQAGSAAADAGPTEPGARSGNHESLDMGPKIPFPMHVGVLAAAADKARPDDATEGEEVPSVFDRQAADKIRLELDNTFGALSRYGIRHVGIVASSTEDKVFLVEQFRKSAPDLRVHLYESSIDLADRSKRQGLEGVMVASSYPLFPMTQAWARGPRQSLQPFPSMQAEGIYNALLALLSRSGVGRDARADAGMLDYRPLTASGESTGPSAWISVSLGNRLWPLATYSPAELTKRWGGGQRRLARAAKLCGYMFPAAEMPARCPALVAPSQPAGIGEDQGTTAAPPRDVHVGFVAMVGAVVILLLMLGNIAGFAINRGGSGRWRIPLLSYAMSADDGDAREELGLHGAITRRRVTLVGLWALALTGAVMGTIIVLPVTFRGLATMAGGYYVFGVVLIAVAFLLAGAHLLKTLRMKKLSRSGNRRYVVIAVQIAFILFMLLLVPVILRGPGLERQDGHVFFFFLRAVDTGIGLTPTLPLFIVGMTIYLAALLQLSVLRRAASLHQAAHEWDVDPTHPGTPGTRTKSFAECATAMRAFAGEASRSVLVMCVVGTVAGFLLLFWSPLRLGSFEGRLFDAACSSGFALVFTVTLATAWRAHALWLRLQAFSRSLALHPASAALDRLPESVAQRFRSPVPGKLGADHIHLALAMNLHALGLTASPHVDTLRRELDARWFPAGQAAPPAPTSPPADDPLAETRAKLKEDFLALKMADVLGLMCDATRRMLLIATVSGMAALFGYAIYPFQPAAALTVAGLISDGMVALVALRVLLGIERDHVLSQLAKTPGGQITPSLGLVARLVGYVIVPLGGLVGSRLQDPGAVIALFQEAAKMLNR